MFGVPDLGPLSMILLVVAVCGVISWAVTQAAKAALLWLKRSYHDAWWFNIAIRCLAVMVGAGCGHLLLPGLLGGLLGACAGVLNTTIVAVIKSKLRSIDVNQGNMYDPYSTIVVPPETDEPVE